MSDSQPVNGTTHPVGLRPTPQGLTEHSDGSIALSARRAHVCKSATWEIEGICRLLASLTSEDDGQSDLIRRGLCGRILQLNSVLMGGLGDSTERTADLERTVYLKPIGEPEAA